MPISNVDCPLLPARNGCWKSDEKEVQARRTYVVLDGILVGDRTQTEFESLDARQQQVGLLIPKYAHY